MVAVRASDIRAAMTRVAARLNERKDHLTELDQAVGDGDLGITAGKMAQALEVLAAGEAPDDNLGKLIFQAGMAVNRAASSTMGTLVATALMRAGKAVDGKAELTLDDVAAMARAADLGIQERGKAKPGDKTVIDALHPAADALENAVRDGVGLGEAGEMALAAARDGLQATIPLRNKVGRAGWVGERTVGKIDPGCAAFVVILEGITGDRPG